MNEEYHELQRLLAGYLHHIAKQSEASCLQIMFTLKTADQVFVMLDYIDKQRGSAQHQNEPFDENRLLDVALAISEQVK